MTALLDTLLEIATEASVVIRGVYDTPFAVEWKGPMDPVTAADLTANALICKRLEAAFPSVPVVAEESDPKTFARYRSANRVFFVDPLDGTAEFVNRNDEFVVMIGLVEDGRAVAGVIAAPAMRSGWCGVVGEGAWRVSESDLRGRTSIRVSGTDALPMARVVSSRSHRSPLLERSLALIGGREIVPVGSAGLKGAEIASGHSDIYVGPGMVGKRWDVCAVDALITAAGGRVTDGFGNAFDYHAENLANETGIVATNGRLHDRVLDGLKRLRDENAH